MSQANWSVETATTLNDYGMRVIPHNPNNPKVPEGHSPWPFANSRTYQLNDVKWKSSYFPAKGEKLLTPVVHVVLDDCLLVDYDGNKKDDIISVEQLAVDIGLTYEDLMSSMVQTNEDFNSLHFLFRINDDGVLAAFKAGKCFKQSNDGGWRKGVDIKTGNQLMDVKQGKILIPFNKYTLLDAPKNLIDTLRVSSPPPANIQQAEITLSEHTSDFGRLKIEEIRRELNGVVEGERNAAFGGRAKRVYEFVAGGEIAENDAIQFISELAVMLEQTDNLAHTLKNAKSKSTYNPRNETIDKNNQRKHMQSMQADRVAQVFKDVVAPNLLLEKSVIKLADVDSKPMQMVNDQMFDALTCRDSLFNSRLADFNGCYHWWNGKAWEISEDSLLRRHIGNAMLSGEIKTTKTRIDGTLSVMKDQLPLMGDINPQERVVFFNNGVLNLDTFELQSHDVKFKNSRYIDVDYSEEFKAPVWDNWLNEIFESDLERKELLQEMLGFCLTRSNLGIEKALLFVGATRSGKGTIAKILKRILDCGASSFNLDQINDNKILSSMIGRNVAIDYECANPQKREAKSVAATFKSITSNDSVTIPLLYTQKPWSGALGCKLLALANSVPRLFDDSGATASRWIPLVFDKSFLGKEDPTLEARLAGELDNIVNWSVIGLKRLVANGKFTSPESSINEMESMKQQGSPIQQFITDSLIVGETEKAFDKDIKASYRQWCMANDEYQLKGADLFTALQDALRSQGVTRKSSVRINPNPSPGRGFTGISVKPIVYAHPIPFEKHYNQVKGGY